MKKIIFAFAALAMTGCAKDTIIDSAETPSKDFIKISPSTTRAPIHLLEDMQSDPAGFQVWIYNRAIDNWYDDNVSDSYAADANYGDYRHVYTDGAWSFATPIAWPEGADDPNATYPLNFYGFYPAVAEIPGVMEAAGGMLNGGLYGLGDVGIVFQCLPGGDEWKTDVALEMTDYLSGRTENVVSKPVSSAVSMTFDHIMSKVDFAVKADAGFTAHVQALGLKNIRMMDTYNIVTDEWGWGDRVNSTVSFYSFNNEFAANYYQKFSTDEHFGTAQVPVRTFPSSGAFEPFYTATNDPANYTRRHLMFIPQNNNFNMWDPGSDKLPQPPTQLPDNTWLGGDTFVQMIYRAETTTPTDYIGYASASRHPDWQAGDYTGPLFVKVGYPFDGEWKQGMGYTYNIELPGATGGYLLDDVYYDDQGNPTDFAVTGTAVTDPLIGDDYIHLSPDVSNWNDAAQSLQ